MATRDLISVAFGAFLAAGLSYISLYVQERVKAESIRKAKLTGLLAELQEHSSLSEQVQLGGGLAKQQLFRSTWEISKGEMFHLPSAFAEILRSTYTAILRFNAVIDYDIAKVPIRDGSLNQAIEVMKNEAREKLEKAIRDLKAHLQL